MQSSRGRHSILVTLGDNSAGTPDHLPRDPHLVQPPNWLISLGQSHASPTVGSLPMVDRQVYRAASPVVYSPSST
jgi:hypothetical protein